MILPDSAATVAAVFRSEGEYRIAVADAAHGSISVSKSTAQKGEVIQVTAMTDEGYHLACLSVAGNNNWYNYGETSYTFTMSESDVTLTPTFLPNTLYSITITPSTGGTVTASQTSACAHDRITLTITPQNDYELENPTIAGIDEEFDGNTFFMGVSDVTVTAMFKPYFTYWKSRNTADVPVEPTPFLTWLNTNAPGLTTYETHWHVLRNGKGAIVTEDTIIQPADFYVIAWRLESNTLIVSRTCTTDELPTATTYNIFNYYLEGNGSVTVTHTVDGAVKIFTVSGNNRTNWQYVALFTAQNIDTDCKWYFNDTELVSTSNIHCENTIAINFYQLPTEATVSPAATFAPTATSASALGETTLADTVVLPWLSTTGSDLYDRALGTGSGLEQLNIVFDGEYQPQDYQLLNVKPDDETQKDTVLVRACLYENEDVTRRSLILSAAQ